MENYLENVLKGFKPKGSKVVIGHNMRVNPDFIVIDVDQDDMPEIVFAFRMQGERCIGVLKRDHMQWSLYNISRDKKGVNSGVCTLVNVLENKKISMADLDKVMDMNSLFKEGENHFISMIDGQLYYGTIEFSDVKVPQSKGVNPEQYKKKPNNQVTNQMAEKMSNQMAGKVTATGSKHGDILDVVENADGIESDLEPIDFKRADLYGEGRTYNVYIVGRRPFGEAGGLITDMEIVVEDPETKEVQRISLPTKAGYSPYLFAGDFTGDGADEVMVVFYSAPNGGFVDSYIYTFNKSSDPKLVFDARIFNEVSNGFVQYLNDLHVDVEPTESEKTFRLDLSNKQQDYLDKIYTQQSKLKEAKEGEISGAIATNPVDYDSNNIYNLAIIQAITGIDYEDVLALLETFFKWNPVDERFVPFMQYVSLTGEDKQ